MKTILLATALAVIATCLGCEDASAKHSDGPHVIALDSSETAKVSTLLERRYQLGIAGKQLDIDEEQLLAELKKAHGMPATAAVSINRQTGRLEEDERHTTYYVYSNGQ